MSMSQVERLLGGRGEEEKDREYLTHGEFIADMRLMFNNALTYNNPDRIVEEVDRVSGFRRCQCAPRCDVLLMMISCVRITPAVVFACVDSHVLSCFSPSKQQWSSFPRSIIVQHNPKRYPSY